MCGILGLQTNQSIDKKLFINSLNLMAHRGPDSEDFYKLNNTMFGHRRLKIIDLSDTANQPMTSSDGLYTIIFNGEIYNYKKIAKELLSLGYQFKTNSDTEILLYGYHAWGKDIVNKLNGMFAFAILNNKNNEIFLARDRIGIKPLYYYLKDDLFIFSSEINPIINLVGKNKLKIDYTSIADFFTYLYVPEEKTVFEDIKKLLPGNFAIFKNKSIIIKEYWSLDPTTKTRFSIDSI